MNATNQLLSILFDEIENGLDQVISTTSIPEHKENYRMASEATKTLKKQVVQSINEASEKVDDQVLSTVLSAVTAAVVAMSAYAYVV